MTTANQITLAALIGEGYMSDQQTAEFLGFSWRKLYRLHLERTGPPRIKIGRKVYYKKASVLEWLDSREQRQSRAGRGR